MTAAAQAPVQGSAKPRWLGYVLCLAAAASFALHTNFSKLSYHHGVDTITILTWRGYLSILVFAIIFAVRRQSPWLGKGVRVPMLIATVFFFLQSFALLGAIAFIPVSLAILLFYLFPVLVMLGSSLLGDEKLTPFKAVGAIVAFIGLCLALNVSGAGLDWRGVAMGIGAALCIALNILSTARAMRSQSPLAVTFNMICISTAIVSVMAVYQGGFKFPTEAGGWWAFIAAIGFVPIAFLCFYSAIPMIGGPRLSLLMNFEPVMSITVAAVLLGEILAPIQYVGGVLVLVAIFGVALFARR